MSRKARPVNLHWHWGAGGRGQLALPLLGHVGKLLDTGKFWWDHRVGSRTFVLSLSVVLVSPHQGCP